jgi:hypothetical protein
MTSITTYRFFSVLLFIGFAALATGCGGNKLKTNRVEGTIEYNGVPLADATVTFYPVGGEATPSFGKTDANGRDTLSTLAGAVNAGTTPGEYTVTVSKRESVPTGTKLRGGENNDEIYDEMILKETLPEKYANVQTSPLKAVVEVVKLNTFDFKLE